MMIHNGLCRLKKDIKANKPYVKKIETLIKEIGVYL